MNKKSKSVEEKSVEGKADNDLALEAAALIRKAIAELLRATDQLINAHMALKAERPGSADNLNKSVRRFYHVLRLTEDPLNTYLKSFVHTGPASSSGPPRVPWIPPTTDSSSR